MGGGSREVMREKSLSGFRRNSYALNGSLATKGRVQLSVLELDHLQIVRTFSLSVNLYKIFHKTFLTYRKSLLYI